MRYCLALHAAGPLFLLLASVLLDASCPTVLESGCSRLLVDTPPHDYPLDPSQCVEGLWLGRWCPGERV